VSIDCFFVVVDIKIASLNFVVGDDAFCCRAVGYLQLRVGDTYIVQPAALCGKG
jgi:hypothetical protein